MLRTTIVVANTAPLIARKLMHHQRQSYKYAYGIHNNPIRIVIKPLGHAEWPADQRQVVAVRKIEVRVRPLQRANRGDEILLVAGGHARAAWMPKAKNYALIVTANRAELYRSVLSVSLKIYAILLVNVFLTCGSMVVSVFIQQEIVPVHQPKFPLDSFVTSRVYFAQFDCMQ
jgi:hypothetical protein